MKKVNSKAIESTIKKSLNKDMKLENVLAYDITLLVDGKEVQPDGDYLLFSHLKLYYLLKLQL